MILLSQLIMEKSFEVLLVEDNPADVRLTQDIFQLLKTPTRINVVHDGAEAMDFLLKKDPFENVKRPDIVLLDLNLPLKDGREVLKEIKSRPELRQIPVLVV